MADDKLPSRYNRISTASSPADRVHTSVSDQSILGRVVSGFIAKLTTNTITRNAEELKARTCYQEELQRLARATLETDRMIEHYRKHRDHIIQDDHEQHLDQMEENRHQRELARIRRQIEKERG